MKISKKSAPRGGGFGMPPIGGPNAVACEGHGHHPRNFSLYCKFSMPCVNFPLGEADASASRSFLSCHFT